MKVTIVTDQKGELVGAMLGHSVRPDPSKRPDKEPNGFRAGLAAGPGQRLHEVEVPDDLEQIKDPDEFGRRLMKHVLKEGLLA